MWLLSALGGVFLLALVNYLDEYLTQHNSVSSDSNIHKRIGGLILISTLLSVIGVCVLKLVVGDVHMEALPLTISLLSAIPMVFMWTAYFYLLNTYPVYQVVPLFQLTSIWLLMVAVATGQDITLLGVAGIALLIVGAYLLDVGKFEWSIPSRLLGVLAGVTLVWSICQYMVRTASDMTHNVGAVSFWQYAGVTILGLILLIAVRQYREGLMYRIKHQGRMFLGFSVVNESLSQASFVLLNFAIALAPVAAYASSISGAQSVFLLGLFLLFPQKKTEVNAIQVAAIVMIALGVGLFELGQ
ncbi:MAG: hypothetical protein JWL87_242 [Candidatus Adlerbacteria bacterium]|nr:hypothetical protein [Candidatus Adlerbacteria bacterium]